MATNTPTVIPADAPPGAVRQLANGTWLDSRGKFLKGSKPSTALVTSADARAAVAIRYQRKADIIRAVASAAVERDDYRVAYGDDAYIAALAETAYIKATTPDDPRAIDAARFLLQETGLDAKSQQQDTAAQAVGAVADVIGALAAFASAITQGGAVQSGDIIDIISTDDMDNGQHTTDNG